jgi:hemerythrin superfamily protein
MGVGPFEMLKLDHRHVEALFEQLTESDEGREREQALSDLEASLSAHMQFEENAVYPLVSAEMDQETAQEANVEHGLAREGLKKLRDLVAAPGFGAAVEMVKAGITHHVREEEGEIFPQLRRSIGEEVKQRLSAEMVAAKKAAGLPVVPPEATKSQLLTIARDLEIEGRSRMERDDLVEAINQTS